MSISPPTITSAPDFSGKQVGPYILNATIGVGAAGNVYQATDTESQDSKLYAIKALPKTRISRKRWFQLVAEVINHDLVSGNPHILSLCDIVEEETYFFLVLDLCETDMYKAIWEQKVYWRNDALIKKAFLEILDGVMACHEKGISHRDLKPENLMCRADGTGIQIGDFGLATNHLICKDGGCGSPYYMSPECWTCAEGDPYFPGLTDIWSLGVILFNMVTTRYPWEAALPSDAKYRAFVIDEDHLFHTFPISDRLNELLKRVLHPAPTKRMSMDAIREAIIRMDTFYKWHPSRTDSLDLSKRLGMLSLDSRQTDVNRVNHAKGKKKHTAATSSIQKLISWTKLHYRSSAGH